MARMVQCIKLGREAEGLDSPPFPGPLGGQIFAQVSREGWAFWLRQQTMLINEYRLNLAERDARQFLTQQMREFFFGGSSAPPAGFSPPPQG